MKQTLASLRQQLDYSFRQPALLAQALTHCSAGAPHNERLEFLGDALLSWLMAEYLYQRFPNANEGELSRLRALLVKKDSLAALAHELDLGAHLNLGAGELTNGGAARDSIAADAMEALFAAVYLDGGIGAAAAVVQHVYAAPLATMEPARLLKDPKTCLQEWLQARHHGLPEYSVAKVQGEPHAQTFTVVCRINSLALTTQGSGSSRRRAEQQAAASMLAQLAPAADKQ